MPLGYLWLAKKVQAATLLAAAVAEPARPPMVERRVVNADKATLCNLRATDEHEIDKMTFEAIRHELRSFGAPVIGLKGECIARLSYHRRLQSERQTVGL